MKYLTGITALFAITVLAASALAAVDSFPISPNPVGPGNTGPDVYLAARFFDLGIDIDGSGSSINPSDIRPGFYAFTGERIIYYVLVRDLNGVDDIGIVYWVHDGAEMGPCDLVPVTGSGSNAKFMAFGNPIEIDTATNLQYDSQTDEVYMCELTVESNWEGSLIHVEANDTAGQTGKTLSEDWNFNPALSVSLTTSDSNPITFGATILDQDVEGATSPNCVMLPKADSPREREDLTLRNCELYLGLPEPEKKCDISFSENTMVITNTGVPNLWPFIAATNFHATTGMAKCPFTNELHANQFEYRALAGTFDSGWRMMPQYSPNLGCNGIDLGSSSPFDPVYGQCRGGCRIPTGTTGSVLGTPGLDILVPGHTVDVRFKIVWPTPCIGEFDDGEFYIIIRAI